MLGKEEDNNTGKKSLIKNISNTLSLFVVGKKNYHAGRKE